MCVPPAVFFMNDDGARMTIKAQPIGDAIRRLPKPFIGNDNALRRIEGH
ncbi:hypothetical protein OCA8868_00050 [Octadecabacter ascidiaceicola]|uniref:Uncharacterized protein n=1 Tax=Octadecabacter ascidiaceicola TaxID=1655543 RepID=A0A238JK10_9RHOB|nr:hypothetical protein OCA8868_00050 [Octadecabacter ascidiaceicola]